MSIDKSRLIYHLPAAIICTAILLILSVEFLLNLTPPIARDALIHHLAVPKLWLKNGGFYEIKWADFSYYPMNIDILYIIPLYFNKDFLANFIHMSFGLGTSFLIYVYLKNKVSHIAGLLGILIFLSTPVIVRLSTQAYVDLGLTFFSTASILAFLRYRDSYFKDFKWLCLSSITMGLALGTKYNALIVWFFLSATIVFVCARDTKESWKALRCGLIFFIIALLVFSPWLIKNAILTGNPFYPLFKGIFNIGSTTTQDGTYSVVSGRTYRGIFQSREMMYGEGFWETVLIPIRYFFEGQDHSRRFFDGVLNPVLIILAPFAFMGKTFYRDKLLFAGFTVFFLLVATFLDQTRIRYILPVVPVLCILTVMGLINIYNRSISLPGNLRFFASASIIFIFVAFMIPNFLYLKNYYRSISPTDYVLGKESRNEFITRRHVGYSAMQYINSHTPKDARVRLILFAGRGYYLDRIYEEGSDYGMNDIRGFAANAKDEKSFQAYLQSLGCTHLLIRTNLFEKFLKDNYPLDTRKLLIQRMNKFMKILYNQDGCAVFEIVIKS